MSRPRIPPLCLLLATILLLSLVAAVGFGAARIPLPTVWSVVSHELWPGLFPADGISRAERNIVWELRLPRVLLGALAGAGLAAVGAVLQVVTRNPLADPYLFGVSAGASVGAVSVILFAGAIATLPVIGGVWQFLSQALGQSLSLPTAAFLGALAAMLAVFAAARGRDGGVTSDRLVLTGVAVAFILHAVTNTLIVASADRSADAALFWMMGGFGTARWSVLPAPALTTLCGLGWLWLRADRINTLALGDDAARSLGGDPGRLRLELFAVTALMTGALVSACGSIGFVGLVLPHIARLLVGGHLRGLLPVAALGGALLLLWVDAAARTLFAPREIPVGMATALVGGAFFLWLMRRRPAP
ncbi:iron complex transport system permease protein [Azospirillum sp. B510]|uniref:FecCD family ABC transporter permease n=1 Tax=Azospirillum sp. (strain B510) TaxID=137722 RepID=UPI0001C4BDF1|nr:iron ABC transporter permease [Azospirillum sp. B510]BAI71120.1 iron complex transport system permease protein [Azospirillum sp. B510]